MEKLNRLFEKFYELSSCGRAELRIKMCLTILKILIKSPSLLIWFPINEKRYRAEFRSEKSGVDFTISLNFSGSYESNDFIRYEFELDHRGGWKLELGHTINGIDYDCYKGEKISQAIVFGTGEKLPVKYGYLIMTLYNKVATQLQAVVAQNKLKNTILETLEALKIQTA